VYLFGLVLVFGIIIIIIIGISIGISIVIIVIIVIVIIGIIGISIIRQTPGKPATSTTAGKSPGSKSTSKLGGNIALFDVNLRMHYYMVIYISDMPSLNRADILFL